MIYILDDFLHLLHNGNSLYYPFYLYHLWSYISDGYNFFFLDFDFSYFFNDSGNLDNFFDQLLNILIDFDNLWDNSLNFDNFWNLNKFCYYFFNFINSRNCGWSLDNLFNDLLSSDNLLNFRFNSDDFFNNCWYFLNDLLNVRDDLLYLLDFFIDYNLFNDFFDVLNSDIILLSLYNLFNELRYLYNFL